MRTTVIPAQITTVEDKIAGNLNLTQIILLLLSLFIAVSIYSVLPHKLQFTPYKIPLFIIEFLTCFTLALRIRGKVVLNWIFVLSSYYLRPKQYVFSKNDVFLRDIEALPKDAKNKAKVLKKAHKKAKDKYVAIDSLEKIRKILSPHREEISLRFDGNGGMNAVWQVK